MADLLADCEAKLKAKQAMKDLLPVAVKPTGRRWAAAAALLLLPVIVLTVTEFAGVTHMSPREAVDDRIKPDGKLQTKAPDGSQAWPADAPKPAIAPFDASQAKQHQEAWAKHLGVPVEFTNSIGMKLRLIPAGEFSAGTEADDVVKLEVDGRPGHFAGVDR